MRKRIALEKTAGNQQVSLRLRQMDRTQRHAVLATISDGRPYTSLVAFAMLPDMTGAVFATPRATAKYRNILRNRQVALLIDTRSNTDAGYMKSEAVTIVGAASPVRQGRRREELASLLIRKHPALKGFVTAKTTSVVLLEAEACFHTGSFQEVSEWRVRASK